jgi:hypothetical protein
MSGVSLNPYFRTLTVNADGYIQHNSVVRVSKGTVLRVIAPQGSAVSLSPFYCNYPIKNEEFQRNKYYQLENLNLKQSPDCLNWDAYYDIECSFPGAYHFFFDKNSDGFYAEFVFILLYF